MWSWDQGRLDYFQFDALRKIAKFAVANDLKNVTIDAISAAVGLPFLPNDPKYRPWRNYSRTFKLSMIATDGGAGSKATPIAHLLAADGKVTTDEYFHFLAEATTSPSPALAEWDASAEMRYPLLFSLKYLLARAAVGDQVTTLAEIVNAYADTGFRGDEDQTAFLGIIGKPRPDVADPRQANESLRVLAQISYLNSTKKTISVSLDKDDALDIFEQLSPIGGVHDVDGDAEIQRIAKLYPSAVSDFELEYSHTIVSDAVQAGFAEGTRVERTHLKIERNAKLRQAYFEANPTSVCDFCETDTHETYPWSPRILDIHHVLPLCSGARTTKNGTVLDDLVANCPTCHRAVHRYYGQWLNDHGRKDFEDAKEARAIYEEAKAARKGT